jgi:hypothetical protein
MLYRGIPNHYLNQVAESLGVENPEVIVQKISPALMQITYPQIDEQFVAREFAEICRAQANYNHSGESVVASRQLQSVFVTDGNRTANLITEALGNAGIGRLPATETEAADFAIVIAQHTLAPSAYSHWLNNSVPHIAVIFDFEGVLVTPVIQAGKTPCLTCFHEQEVAKDSAWPEIASQLLFSEQKFDDSTSRLFGAAIACQRALDSIDASGGFKIEERNRIGYRLNLKAGTVSEFRWDFSSNCLCQQ